MKGWTDDGWGGDRWEHGDDKPVVAHTPLLSYLRIPVVRGRRRPHEPAAGRATAPLDRRR